MSQYTVENRSQTLSSSPTISSFERLPTEILQQIFFSSLNANILIASPRIAVKLSGSQSIYRATFLITFYSHQFRSVTYLFGSRGILSWVPASISSWEAHSMTKAALNSRWCNWGFVKNLMIMIHAKVFAMFSSLVLTRSELSDKISNAIIAATNDSDQCTQYFYENHALRGNGAKPYSFNLMINVFRVDLTRTEHGKFGCMRIRRNTVISFYPAILGTLFINGDKEILQACSNEARLGELLSYLMDRPCRPNRLSRERLRYPPEALYRSFRRFQDPYEDMEWQVTDAAPNGQEQRLREALVKNYLLWPSDYPFTLPSSLYRSAALYDKNHKPSQLENPVIYPAGYLTLRSLFKIDPYSLPREDLAISRWAIKARNRVKERNKLEKYWLERMENFRLERLENPFPVEMVKRWYDDDDGVLTTSVDIDILYYLKTGKLDYSRSSFTPDFTQYIKPLHRQIHSVVVDDVDFQSWEKQYWSQADRIRHSDPLGFLGPLDFTGASVRADMQQEDGVLLSQKEDQTEVYNLQGPAQNYWPRLSKQNLDPMIHKPHLTDRESQSDYIWFQRPFFNEIKRMSEL